VADQELILNRFFLRRLVREWEVAEWSYKAESRASLNPTQGGLDAGRCVLLTKRGTKGTGNDAVIINRPKLFTFGCPEFVEESLTFTDEPTIQRVYTLHRINTLSLAFILASLYGDCSFSRGSQTWMDFCGAESLPGFGCLHSSANLRYYFVVIEFVRREGVKFFTETFL